MTKSSYRWWTVKAWWNQWARGVKLGPVTVCWFHGFGGPGWWFYFGVMNRIDGLMRRLNSRP